MDDQRVARGLLHVELEDVTRDIREITESLRDLGEQFMRLGRALASTPDAVFFAELPNASEQRIPDAVSHPVWHYANKIGDIQSVARTVQRLRDLKTRQHYIQAELRTPHLNAVRISGVA